MQFITGIINALSKALGTSLETSKSGWIKLAILFTVLVIGGSVYQIATKIDPHKVIEKASPTPTPSTETAFCQMIEETVICQRPGNKLSPSQKGRAPQSISDFH
jgi:hypothetical protein